MIVAEVGFNWSDYASRGNSLHKRMELLAATGVGWVKFQLCTQDMVPPEVRWMCIDNYSAAMAVVNAAKRVGLNPFFTPMFPEAVAWCGDDHIKIRYKDRANYTLIRRAVEKARCVWVSGQNVWCVSKYPATKKDYLVRNEAGEVRWGQMEGVSFHCPDISLAMKHGYKNQYIEYHVKFSESDYEAKWSIGLEDLKTLVDWSNS